MRIPPTALFTALIAAANAIGAAAPAGAASFGVYAVAYPGSYHAGAGPRPYYGYCSDGYGRPAYCPYGGYSAPYVAPRRYRARVYYPAPFVGLGYGYLGAPTGGYPTGGFGVFGDGHLGGGHFGAGVGGGHFGGVVGGGHFGGGVGGGHFGGGVVGGHFGGYGGGHH